MSLPNILRRASTLFYNAEESSVLQPHYEDGEIVFCKNNICVHRSLNSASNEVVHHPGYLSIVCQYKSDDNTHNNKQRNSTLLLSWIPNSSLQQNLVCELPTDGIHGCGTMFNRNENEENSHLSCDTFECANSITSTDSFCSGCMTHEPSIGSIASTSSSPELTVIDCNFNIENSALNPSHSLENRSRQDSFENENCVVSNKSANEPLLSDIHDATLISNKLEDIEHLKEPALLYAKNVTTSQDSDPTSILRSKAHIKNNSINQKSISSRDVENHSLNEDIAKRLSISCTIENGISKLNLNPTVTTPIVEKNSEHLSGRRKNRFSFVWMSPENYALRYNLNFPDSNTSSPLKIQNKPKSCRKFCVDLSEMKSLRLFFSNGDNRSGQLVIASKESQYKILHFHHGGLDKLSNILTKWNLFISKPVSTVDGLPAYKHFFVYQPRLRENEQHPEEGKVVGVTIDLWHNMLNNLGQIIDDLVLRKAVFFGGVEKKMRSTVWPFLLHCYSYQSTYEERYQTQNIRKFEYEDIMKRRFNLTGEARETFIKNIQYVIEKDVVRTDRSNPFYAGENNPHVETMKNILLNYALYDKTHGYTQGMSDLLAPILAEILDETEAFWCFVGIMRKGLFVCTPTDSDMEHNLNYLRELIRVMYPPFYKYMNKHSDGRDLLFCHRWLLLCFKREFTEEVALSMWEACWSNYLTDYFHLFLCLAIIMIYSDDIISQALKTDEALFHFSSLAMYMDGYGPITSREFTEEVALSMWEACWSNYLTDYFHLFLCLAIIMIYSDDIISQALKTDEALFHFSSLAMYMDGYMVLRKARGLLHVFRLLPKLPCTLASLCQQCGPGIWDSDHVPVVECVGTPNCQRKCAYIKT